MKIKNIPNCEECKQELKVSEGADIHFFCIDPNCSRFILAVIPFKGGQIKELKEDYENKK